VFSVDLGRFGVVRDAANHFLLPGFHELKPIVGALRQGRLPPVGGGASSFLDGKNIHKSLFESSGFLTSIIRTCSLLLKISFARGVPGPGAI
jgi:hypothetical protein